MKHLYMKKEEVENEQEKGSGEQMEIRQLVYFVAVAEKGTITEAAKSLHISQPPVSVQLKLLEEELGCVLFDRNTRHMELTEAGQKFYQRASAILEQFDSARREMRDIESGSRGHIKDRCGFFPVRWDVSGLDERIPKGSSEDSF